MPLKPRYTIHQGQLGLSSAKPIAIQLVEVRSNVPPHDHDYDEISILVKGTATHRTTFRDEMIDQGSVIVVSPEQTHAFRINSECKFINLYYLSEWLADDLREAFDADGLLSVFAARQLRCHGAIEVRRSCTLNTLELNAVRRDAADIAEELKRDKPSKLFLKSALVKLLIRLNRAFMRQWPQEFSRTVHPQVRQLISQIEEQLTGQPIEAPAAVSRKSLSKGHIARLFKQEFGFSPREYFQRRRILYAANLLLESRISISEIASRTGFSDGAHFARIFTREKGLSPRSFRKAYTA